MAKTCSICPNKHYAKSYCTRHYTTWKAYGDPEHSLARRDGISSHPLYTTYTAMIRRCTNPTSIEDAAMYKDRGITVCNRWLESIYNFIADMGERPAGTSLDRIDNSKGYSTDNCRWATPREQALNTRKNNSHPNIYYAKHRDNWYVQFLVNGKRIGKGGIKTLEKAMKVREDLYATIR